MSTEEAEKYASTIRISGKTGKIKEADKHVRTLINELESKNKEIERYDARITELENALNAMLKVFEYDGQGEGENVACWDARVALKVYGYNK